MSKIEVNTIDTQCGSALQIGDGNTATIGLGKSGDTITVPCGATIVNSGTATGFGRTGTVDWVTTPKVTGDSPITAVTGEGYFLNTTAGEITINLPAGAAGSIVSVADYAATWQTNKVTVAANGSEKIGGVAQDATLDTEGQSVTFVYVDSTQGWVNTMDSTSNVRGIPPFVAATGGNQPTATGCIVCTDYKVHTFTGPGTFTVTNAGSPPGSTTVDYMVVAGGGSGGSAAANAGGAGGAGGFRASPGTASGCYTASPRGAAPATAIAVSVQGYPIVVGGGAPQPTTPEGGSQGSNSSGLCITSTGGGAGGLTYFIGGDGGSGGGGGGGAAAGKAGGAGNTPPTNPVQGMNGGIGGSPGGSDRQGGGGGGAIAVGTNAAPTQAGPGGIGAGTAINPSPSYGTPGPSAPLRYFAGGGGGGGSADTPNCKGAGGAGGGGNGGCTPTGPNAGVAGTINTGGGGGGGANCNPGGAGGSGAVIIRYKFQ